MVYINILQHSTAQVEAIESMHILISDKHLFLLIITLLVQIQQDNTLQEVEVHPKPYFSGKWLA